MIDLRELHILRIQRSQSLDMASIASMASEDPRSEFAQGRGDVGFSAASEHLDGIILTKTRFCFMDVPPELRLKIYPYLLISDSEIVIASGKQQAVLSVSSYPYASILQTCKAINEEGTPFLYARNRFLNYFSTNPTPSFHLRNTFLPASLRWSTIALLNTITFQSDSNLASLTQERSLPCAHFTCSGTDILALFTASELTYSADGPDDSEALSITSWVSRALATETLKLCVQSMKSLMTTTPLDALQDQATDPHPT